MTVQERMEISALIERLLPVLSGPALYSLGLACTALAHSAGPEDAETPRETFEAVLDMLNVPNTKALGNIACALANSQVAGHRSAQGVFDTVLGRIRRADS